MEAKRLIDVIFESEANEFYHVTFSKNVAKIKQNGLVPKKKATFTGAIGQDVRRHKGSIYAFNHVVDALRMAFKLDWDTHEPVSIVVFKPTDPTEWTQDEHWESGMAVGQWLVKAGTEPASNVVKIIGPEEWKEKVKIVGRSAHDQLTQLTRSSLQL
jgi:hypothetical protein